MLQGNKDRADGRLVHLIIGCHTTLFTFLDQSDLRFSNCTILLLDLTICSNNFLRLVKRSATHMGQWFEENGKKGEKGSRRIPSADINVGNLDEYVGRHGNKFKRFLEK